MSTKCSLSIENSRRTRQRLFTSQHLKCCWVVAGSVAKGAERRDGSRESVESRRKGDASRGFAERRGERWLGDKVFKIHIQRDGKEYCCVSDLVDELMEGKCFVKSTERKDS